MLKRNAVFMAFVTGAFVLAIGCQKNNLNGDGSSPFGYLPNCLPPSCYITGGAGAYPTPTPFSAGGSATLSVISQSVLNQYEGSPTNNPGAITINVNTTSNGGYYLGTVHIRFMDGNFLHDGVFTNGTDTGHGNAVSAVQTDANTGLPTYRLFFEDPMGVIILTLHDTGTGTDTGPLGLKGEVWFRNFAATSPNPLYQGYSDGINYWPANPNAFCWTITLGPYDCQNFSTPPSTGGSKAVIELGTFTGMDKHGALGI